MTNCLRALGVCLALCTTSLAQADSAAGAISFSQPLNIVAQNAGVALITLNRTVGSTGTALATYVTFDSSALAGSDYTATQGTISWADGDWAPKAVMVPISPLGAGGGAFTVSLMSSSGATFGNLISTTVLIAPPANTATVSASGAIQFSEPVYSVAPDATSVVATLNRIHGSSGSALATYMIFSGTALTNSAFTRSSGTLTWDDGDFSPISFSVPIVPNAAGQSFSLALITASGAAFGDPIAATVSVRQTAAGAVTLSWTAPTQNTDGSALTDLAGYYIYYGTPGGQATQTLQLPPSATSVVLPNLSQGTWYFGTMAYNASGATSGLSGVASATIE